MFFLSPSIQATVSARNFWVHLPMGGTEFPNPVLRALLFALLCFLGPFMDSFRCCSRTVKCGTALTATSDVSVTDCGHDYCTGCLLKLQAAGDNAILRCLRQEGGLLDSHMAGLPQAELAVVPARYEQPQ